MPLPTKPIIRVTQLEKFRRYMSDASSFDTEQSVIDTICGEFKGNELTRIGTAFHSIIETGDAANRIYVDGHGVIFNDNQVNTAIDYRNEFPDAFHEVRAYKDYGRAIVTGCADLINGLDVRDIKTKFSTPNDADYIDSSQWKFYLDIFNADAFHYDLFIFENYKKDKHGYDVSELTLNRYTPPITCYRYPDMQSDNLRLVNMFMDWAESKGLTEFLNPKL